MSGGPAGRPGGAENGSRIPGWVWWAGEFVSLVLVLTSVNVILTRRIAQRGVGVVELEPSFAWAIGLAGFTLAAVVPLLLYLRSRGRH